MDNTEKIARLVSLVGENEGVLSAAIIILKEYHPEANIVINMLKKSIERSDNMITKIIFGEKPEVAKF